jgi:putative membrane protein
MDLVSMMATWSGHDGGPWFLIFPLLWIVLIVVAVVLWRGRSDRGGSRTAEAVLAERYARGEIPEEEYRERLTVLRGKGR